MDWSKATNIFIVSFLVLNIILGYQLYTSREQKVETIQLAKSRVEELKQIMRLKQIGPIEMVSELPKEVPDLNFLYVENERPAADSDGSEKNDEPDKTFLSPAIEVSDGATVEQITEALKDLVPLQNYQYDSFLSSNEKRVFHQMEQGVPLFPSYLGVLLEDNQIVAVEKQTLRVLRQGTERKVISAFTALRTVVESYLPDQSKIVDIRIGYHGQQYNSDVQVLAPVWRIALEDGGIYYVNAITGAVDIPQTEEVE